jgi:maltooligosyltrehalose synthase
MCELRTVLTLVFSVVLFAGCLSLSLYFNAEGAKRAADQRIEQFHPRPDAIARLHDMIHYRLAPFQPQAAEILAERFSQVCV